MAAIARRQSAGGAAAVLKPENGLAAAASGILDRVRAARPRVHCITNTVAQNFTANVLLALGAVPSMTVSPEEIAGFVSGADALLVNLGTLDAERRKAIGLAIDAAAEKELPWVLDPALIDRSLSRARYAQRLIRRRPGAVRLNRDEFAALAGFKPEGGALTGYGRDNLTVVALSGEIDHVSDGFRLVTIENGDPAMGLVTAMGCACSAVTAAFLAVEKDAWTATASALVAFGVAGEIAGTEARGPGSFAVAMLDVLHRLDRERLISAARIV